MRKILYVSNVANASELDSLEDLFSTVGDVKKTHLELIPESGHTRTFGVVEMLNEQQAMDCIERFNGQSVNGQHVAVVSTRPQPRPPVVVKAKKRRS